MPFSPIDSCHQDPDERVTGSQFGTCVCAVLLVSGCRCDPIVDNHKRSRMKGSRKVFPAACDTMTRRCQPPLECRAEPRVRILIAMQRHDDAVRDTSLDSTA